MFQILFLFLICAVLAVYWIYSSDGSGAAPAKNWLSKGKKALADGDYKSAEMYFIHFLVLNPSEWEGWNFLLDTELKLANQDRRFVIIRIILDLLAGDEQARLLLRSQLSDYLFSQKEYAEAFYHYCLLAETGDKTATARLAWLYASQGKWKEARSWYQRILEKEKDVEVQKNLAFVDIAMGNFQGCDRILLEQITQGMGVREDHYILARLYEMENFEKACEFALNFLQDSQESSSAWVLDCISLILIPYYERSFFPEKNQVFWIDILKRMTELTCLTKELRQEILWQLGGCLTFYGEKGRAREIFEILFALNDDYKQVSAITDILVNSNGSEERLMEILRNEFSLPSEISFEIRPLDLSSFFLACEFPAEALKIAASKSAGTASQRLSLGMDRFVSVLQKEGSGLLVLRMIRVCAGLGYKIIEILPSKKDLAVIVADKNGQEMWLSLTVQHGEIGEFPVHTFRDRMKEAKKDKGVVLSLGTWSSSAQILAKKFSIQLFGIKDFQHWL